MTTNPNSPEVSSLNEEHPVRLYFLEKDLITSLLEELENTDPLVENQKFYNVFNQLQTIEKRFQRKENQLFPLLEQKRGWNSETQRMWSFHDTLREQFRLLRKKIEERQWTEVAQDSPYLINGVSRLLEMEENVLFPFCFETLTEEDWKTIRAGEEEIGWMISNELKPSPEQENVNPDKDNSARQNPFSSEEASHFDEGFMTVEQVNLLLKTMPLDITYVDENDKVIFYNRGEERLFPRSPGIIGREVKFCHPPKSVGTVLKILEKFRKGTRSEASFWINIKDRLIYIRYFAVRDAQKNYKGVLEMSQDITDIKKIEGEKRLLDWD